jgi:hypothetical protein
MQSGGSPTTAEVSECLFFSSPSDFHKPTAVPQTEYYRQKAVLIYMRDPNGVDDSLDSRLVSYPPNDKKFLVIATGNS